MTEITAVLERHSRVEVKWGVSRNRQTSSEVWEEERKSIQVKNPCLTTKTLLQPHLWFHTCRQIERHADVNPGTHIYDLEAYFYISFFLRLMKHTHTHTKAGAFNNPPDVLRQVQEAASIKGYQSVELTGYTS